MNLYEPKRGDGPVHSAECGCQYVAKERVQAWVRYCPTHEAEVTERHARAWADYRAAMAAKVTE